jgi:hypothetical protein
MLFQYTGESGSALMPLLIVLSAIAYSKYLPAAELTLLPKALHLPCSIWAQALGIAAQM